MSRGVVAFLLGNSGSRVRANRLLLMAALLLSAYALRLAPFPLLFAEGLPEAVGARLDAVVSVWAHDD